MNSINRTARMAGVFYLLMAPLGLFGILYVTGAIVVPGDAAATAANLGAKAWLFRLGIVSALATQLVNTLVVLLLYRVLKVVNKGYAALMVIFILLGVPIAMLSELNNLAALYLVSNADSLAATSAEQLYAQVMLFLQLRAGGIGIAQIFWGLWLLPMGYLVFKSGFLPRLLGILLMVGGVGYLIDFGLFFLFPGVESTISQYTFIGELLLPLWLLIKGVDVAQWEKRSLAAPLIDTGARTAHQGGPAMGVQTV